MIVIGIDNGLDGGVVALRGSRPLLRWVTPTIGEGKRSYDLQLATGILRALRDDRPNVHAFLEQAHAMPKQGVSSMFSTGFGFGCWQGALAALQIPFDVVAPQTWQKVMFIGLPKGDTKANSAIVAQRQRPTIDWRATERCKKAHDGLTDAYCIASWGERQLASRQNNPAAAQEHAAE